MKKAFPTTRVQDTVLAALGLTAKDYTEAEAIFARLGIVVASRREGRSFVPVIREASHGAFNAYGEGEDWSINLDAVDLSPLAQWMTK